MRILLADSQPKVRHALRVLLEHQPELEIVGEVVDARDLVTQTKATRPELLLLHWRLRGWSAADPSAALRTDPAASSGQALLGSLRETCPGLAVIVLSGNPEVEEAALVAGADAFVSKGDPPQLLLKTIAEVKQAKNATVTLDATLADE